MAHAIIFTDLGPRTWTFNKITKSQAYFNYPAGAYKIASVLRNIGLTALVVPNCLSLSAAGIQHIIKNNSKDLVWVGISTTLLPVKSSQFDLYRKQWLESPEHIIGINNLSKTSQDISAATELPLSSKELNYLSHWLETNFQAPLLIGGAWISHIKNGNLSSLNKNCYLVTGTAERYVENFTVNRIANKNYEPPFICSNGNYDDTDFKNSSIIWSHTDFTNPDAFLPLEIARGCAFNCSYCSYNRKSTFEAYKNPSTLRQELIKNYEMYGITKYMLVDDLYNDSKQKVRELYDKVWSKLPFKPEWTSYMRLDMLYADKESAEYIKHSGAKMGSFGIETLDDRAGRSVGKGLGKRRILETLDYLKKTWGDDVLVTGFFIAGLPYETKESIEETIDWTFSTDLLYSFQWAPMWLTPPTHFDIVETTQINQIAKNTNNWGVRWLSENNWINSTGVTYHDVNSMVIDIYKKMSSTMSVNFANYGDLRIAGLTHNEIANLNRNTEPEKLIMDKSTSVNDLIQMRLTNILNLSDQTHSIG